MSGTFMDGGSGTFMDGGSGHEHSSHGMHFNHGGDGLGMGDALHLGNHHHNLFSHLLGLDHNHHAEHAHGTSNVYSATDVSHMPLWASALNSTKLSNLWNGITLTANFWLLILFFGFAAWLFVVYWVRHNDPMSKQILGTNMAGHSAHADRRIISNMKNAFPFKVSANTGTFYVPNSETPPPMPSSGQAYADVLTPVQNHETTTWMPTAPTSNQISPTNSYISPMPYPVSFTNYRMPNLQATSLYKQTWSGSTLNIAEQSLDGIRVKTIVNR